MKDHDDHDEEALEPIQPLPVTPPRTYVNAGMSGTYIPKWTQIREGADDNQRYVSHGNLT